MNALKSLASSAGKFVDDILESSDDEETNKEEKNLKMLKNDQEMEAAKEKGENADSKMRQAAEVAGEALDIAGEIALDVLTGGIYGLTTNTIDASDGLDKLGKDAKVKGEEVDFGDQCDVVADAYTGGLYSMIMGTDEEEGKKAEETSSQGDENAKQGTAYNNEDISDLTDGQKYVFKALMAAGVNVDDGKAMSIKFNDNLAAYYRKLIENGMDHEEAMKICLDKIGDTAEK